MNSEPLISIIMPAFNAARYIEEAILSAQSQTYRYWELIVIDDGSTDSTAVTVKNFQATDDRITYYYQNNMGLGYARNAGISRAQGEWIAFLDSDDVWLPDKLQRQTRAINSTEADIIFSNGFYWRNEEPVVKPYDTATGYFTGEQLYTTLITHNYIPVVSACIRRALAGKIGMQDTHPLARGCEDWDYWLRACHVNARFYGLSERLFKYRQHDSNMSSKRLAMQIAVAYVQEKNYKAEKLMPSGRLAVKRSLLSAARLMVKNLSRLEFSEITGCVRLLFRILLVTSSSIPALLTAKRKLPVPE